jgi:hypothetical protein
MRKLPRDGGRGSSDFQRIVDPFLLQPGLPFAEALSAERIKGIFAEHGNLFGEDGFYSTALMVWAFLGKVLHDRFLRRIAADASVGTELRRRADLASQVVFIVEKEVGHVGVPGVALVASARTCSANGAS